MSLVPLFAQEPGAISGRVLDAATREPLARVLVQLDTPDLRATTRADGTFDLGGIPAGSYTLRVSTVGYQLARQAFQIEAGETRTFEVLLAPSTGTRRESVEVQTGPFELERQESPAALTLTGTEAKNLAGVLADDPLRAVQSLPGVTSNNDFNSEFSMRGASFDRIGIFLDGVLLHEPFHMVEGQGSHGSLTVFNGDIIEDMTLYEGAWPVKYGDRTAGVLNVETRDPSKDFGLRVSAGMTNTSVLAEGPLSRSKKLRGMVDFRKSYLQYLLDRIDTNVTALAFGFTDLQGRLAYELSDRHRVSLSFFHAVSDLDRSAAQKTLGINALLRSEYQFTMLNFGDRWSPSPAFIVSSRVAWTQERGTAENPSGLSLGDNGYGEWLARTDASWLVWPNATMSFGAQARRLREDGSNLQYSGLGTLLTLDRWRGTGMREGAYWQQQAGWFAGRLQATAGVRMDHSNVNGMTPVSPYASLALQPFRSTRVQFGWGQYAQFPQLAQSWSLFGSRNLLPERATHYEFSIEQMFDAKTRLRMELYDRQDRDLLWRPLFDPRLLPSGAIFPAPNGARVLNSQRGYGRGAQIFIQRRTANGFTGWVSYSYGVARVRDGVLHLSYPTDNDQRHTVNVFAGYRLRPTVNLSVKWLYGSGFPIPGFYRMEGANFYLAGNRNQLRLPGYQRLDFRVNKSFVRDKWKWTLYAECVNITNRTNQRFDAYNGFNTRTGQAFPSFMSMFPILPAAGLVVER